MSLSPKVVLAAGLLAVSCDARLHSVVRIQDPLGLAESAERLIFRMDGTAEERPISQSLPVSVTLVFSDHQPRELSIEAWAGEALVAVGVLELTPARSSDSARVVDLLAPCATAPEGSGCSRANSEGICLSQRCVESTCGDGFVDSRVEACEPSNPVPACLSTCQLNRPSVVLSNVPTGSSSALQLNVAVSGARVFEYQWSLRTAADESSCADTDLGSWHSVSDPIVGDMGVDGPKLLCVRGRDTDGLVQAGATALAWKKDATAPIVSLALEPQVPSVVQSTLVVGGKCETGLPVILAGESIVTPVAAECDGGTYSASVALTPSDGLKRLSATQSDDAGNVGTATAEVRLDVAPPDAPGGALGIEVNPVARDEAILTWASPAADRGLGVAEQYVDLFGNDRRCDGEPDVSIPVAASADRALWPRLDLPVFGQVRFRVRAVDGAGRSAASTCTGDLRFHNGVVTVQGNTDDLGIGSTPPQLADLTGDGIDEIIFQSSGVRPTYIAILDPVPLSTAQWHIFSFQDEDDGSARNLQLFDFDGDGIKDVVVTEDDIAGWMRVFILSGKNGLPPSGRMEDRASTGYRWFVDTQQPTQLRVLDVAGDSHPDLVLVNSFTQREGTSGALAVIEGGAEHTPPGDLEQVGWTQYGLRGIDIEDIAPLHFNGEARILVAVNDALFAPPRLEGSWDDYKISASTPLNSHTIALVDDVTCDGITDAVLYGHGTLFILDGAHMLDPSLSLEINSLRHYHGGERFGPEFRLLDDVTGDGCPDIGASPSKRTASFGFGGLSYTVIPAGAELPDSGALDADNRAFRWSMPGSITQLVAMVAGDVTADGKNDLLIFDKWNGVFVLDGSPTLPASGPIEAVASAAYSVPQFISEGSVQIVDLTGDGHPEALLAGDNEVLLVGGEGGLEARRFGLSFYSALGVDDYDQDGIDEAWFVGVDAESYRRFLWIDSAADLSGDTLPGPRLSRSNYLSTAEVRLLPPGAPTVVVISDPSGLAADGFTTGAVSTLSIASLSNPDPVAHIHFGVPGGVLQLDTVSGAMNSADLDEDGNLEVLLGTSADSLVSSSVQVLEIGADGRSHARTLLRSDWGLEELSAGSVSWFADADGDGRLDVVVSGGFKDFAGGQRNGGIRVVPHAFAVREAP